MCNPRFERISYHDSLFLFVIFNVNKCMLLLLFFFSIENLKIDGRFECIKCYKISGLSDNWQPTTTSENCANKMNQSICHKSPQTQLLLSTAYNSSLDIQKDVQQFRYARSTLIHSIFSSEFPNVFSWT